MFAVFIFAFHVNNHSFRSIFFSTLYRCVHVCVCVRVCMVLVPMCLYLLCETELVLVKRGMNRRDDSTTYSSWPRQQQPKQEN